MRHKVIIADDHPLVRDGLIATLEAEPDFEVVGEAEDGAAIFRLVEQLNPDALVLDVLLGSEDGLALIKNLRAPFPGLKILVVTIQDEGLHAHRCREAGAMGFVSKLEPSAEVVAGLRQILRGRTFFRAELDRSPFAVLTDRELHVLRLLGRGLKMSEIAAILHISPRTVEAHRENLKRKLGAATSTQLMRLALEARL